MAVFVKLQPLYFNTQVHCYKHHSHQNEALKKPNIWSYHRGVIYLARRLGRVPPKGKLHPAVGQEGAHLVARSWRWPVMGDTIMLMYEVLRNTKHTENSSHCLRHRMTAAMQGKLFESESGIVHCCACKTTARCILNTQVRCYKHHYHQ